MEILPQGYDTAEELLQEDGIAVETSRTYKIDWEEKRIGGFVTGEEAVKQAVAKALQTERFQYPAYGWDYGAELGSLLGETLAVAEAEAERMISEALLADDRILEVVDFWTEAAADGMLRAGFTVRSIFGDLPYSVEVMADG